MVDNQYSTFLINIVMAFSLVFWASPSSNAQSCDSIAGFWINQDSSVIQIDVPLGGKLSGHYQSNASDDATFFPFTGYINRDGNLTCVSFMVSWAEYGSITSWTGYCKEKAGEPTMTTLWHLVRPYVDEDWERFVTNKSTFKPFKR